MPQGQCEAPTGNPESWKRSWPLTAWPADGRAQQGQWRGIPSCLAGPMSQAQPVLTHLTPGHTPGGEGPAQGTVLPWSAAPGSQHSFGYTRTCPMGSAHYKGKAVQGLRPESWGGCSAQW